MMTEILREKENTMFLEGLDELDQKIVQLLIKNARMSYSEIGSLVGISRVAVKMRVQSLEKQGRDRRVHYHYQSAEDQRGSVLLFRD